MTVQWFHVLPEIEPRFLVALHDRMVDELAPAQIRAGGFQAQHKRCFSRVFCVGDQDRTLLARFAVRPHGALRDMGDSLALSLSIRGDFKMRRYHRPKL